MSHCYIYFSASQRKEKAASKQTKRKPENVLPSSLCASLCFNCGANKQNCYNQ